MSVTVVVPPAPHNDDSQDFPQKISFKTMFSATETTVRHTTTEDVDGIVEFECMGFWSRIVWFDQEGEEETVTGFGDDRIGKFYFITSVAVFKFLFA